MEITDRLLKPRSWPLGVSSSLAQRPKQVIMAVEIRVDQRACEDGVS